MASNDASQLAGVLGRRVALQGSFCTSWGARVMSSGYPATGDGSASAGAADAAGDAPELAAGPADDQPTTEDLAEFQAFMALRRASTGAASAAGDALQLPDGSADATGDAHPLPAGPADGPPAPAQLRPEDVIAIQNAEAAEFRPPRSLHDLARDALNSISFSPTREPVVLDGVFPWVRYVAAHRQSAEIIGPGITQAIAKWTSGTNDGNRGGAPRLDFHFTREDGTVCRVHPGQRSRADRYLIFEDAP